MDSAHPEIVYLVLCLVVLLVIGLNVGLWTAFRRRSNNQSIDTIRKAAKTAQSPFAKEDRDLIELSRRVAELKSSQKDDNPPHKED